MSSRETNHLTRELSKNHRNTNISLLIRRIVRNFATRWHCGVCQRIFVYESVRLLCERGGITVRGSVGQRNKKQTTFIISVLCSQNSLCLMAMRHLWCACTKFQPNPALRLAVMARILKVFSISRETMFMTRQTIGDSKNFLPYENNLKDFCGNCRCLRSCFLQ